MPKFKTSVPKRQQSCTAGKDKVDGPAPKGLASTGDPSFCTLWTYCGMPAISLPLLESTNGLPIGVQLVGPRDDDARLLRTAKWLAAKVATG